MRIQKVFLVFILYFIYFVGKRLENEILNDHVAPLREIFTSQLLLSRVQSIRTILLDRSETSQDLHELQEIHSVVSALLEEGVHYSLAQRIYRQFRDSEKVLSTERSAITAIQTRETAVQPFDLIRRNCNSRNDSSLYTYCFAARKKRISKRDIIIRIEGRDTYNRWHSVFALFHPRAEEDSIYYPFFFFQLKYRSEFIGRNA